MSLKTTILLITFIWSTHTRDIPAHGYENPVYLLDLNNVVIDGFDGSITAKSMELFGNVETLAIRNCNATSFNENFLKPLKNLKKLSISNSHYEREIDDVSDCCGKLREIRLIDSSVSDIDKKSFQKMAAMSQLERVYFLRMHVPTLISNVFAGSNLKKLEILDSNLATIEDGAFNGMDELELLDLQHNKLKTIPTASLAAVKTLKELSLEGNLLQRVTTADFPLLPNLEKLNLGHNPIKEINLDGLKEKLPKIKRVIVSGIDIDPSEAKGIPLLRMQIG